MCLIIKSVMNIINIRGSIFWQYNNFLSNNAPATQCIHVRLLITTNQAWIHSPCNYLIFNIKRTVIVQSTCWMYFLTRPIIGFKDLLHRNNRDFEDVTHLSQRGLMIRNQLQHRVSKYYGCDNQTRKIGSAYTHLYWDDSIDTHGCSTAHSLR